MKNLVSRALDVLKASRLFGGAELRAQKGDKAAAMVLARGAWALASDFDFEHHVLAPPRFSLVLSVARMLGECAVTDADRALARFAIAFASDVLTQAKRRDPELGSRTPFVQWEEAISELRSKLGPDGSC